MSARAEALADRIIQGAQALAAYAEGLSDDQWATPSPDGRPVGVVVHHVADVYPLEIDVAMLLAEGKPVDATWDDIHAMNANHAKEYAGVTKDEALAHLRTNSATAAERVRQMSDAQLDSAAPLALYANATLTSQFFLEDHPVRHSLHHLAKIKQATS
jgi:hypothetical protein